MNYTLEVLREDWEGWVKGDLQDCLVEFFILQEHPIPNQVGLRLTWKGDE